MKRTRRIEVIRYTKRSMEIEGCYIVADPAASAQPIIEITRADTAAPEPAGKEPAEQMTYASVDAMPSRRGLKLRYLLRLRR